MIVRIRRDDTWKRLAQSLGSHVYLAVVRILVYRHQLYLCYWLVLQVPNGTEASSSDLLGFH